MPIYLVVLGNKNRDKETGKHPTHTSMFGSVEDAKADIENSNDVWRYGACVIDANDHSVVAPPYNPNHPAFKNNEFLKDAYDRDWSGNVIIYHVIVKFDSEYQYYAGNLWTNDIDSARYYIHSDDAQNVIGTLNEVNDVAVFTSEHAPKNPKIAPRNAPVTEVGPDPHHVEVETLRSKHVFVWAIPLGNGLCLWLDSSNNPVKEIEDAYEFATQELAEGDKPPFYSVPGSCVLIKVMRTTSITRVK